MREIKFRAWIENAMCYDIAELEFKYFCIVVDDHPSGDRGFSIDKAEIMQCTGLKDQNGVGVFEGDLVLMSITHEVNSFKEASYSEIDLDDNRTFQKISMLPCEVRKYKDGGYEFYNHEFDKSRPFWISYKEISEVGKVCGNIHENPELLK